MDQVFRQQQLSSSMNALKSVVMCLIAVHLNFHLQTKSANFIIIVNQTIAILETTYFARKVSIFLLKIYLILILYDLPKLKSFYKCLQI